MHQKLIIEVFIKIKEIEKERTGIEPSTSVAAKLISEFILEKKKTPFGPKSLTDYHREAENEKEEKRDVTIKQPKVVEAMCNLLGFDNFAEFKKVYEPEPPLKLIPLIIQFYKRNKIAIIICFFIIIATSIIFSINKQRWMVWQEYQYVEAKFDIQKYDINQLKVYKKERILNFKQIIPDCNTHFFNVDGSENLWYGKNAKKELEFFTSLGLHPETGKTLDPITDYMIKKYICETYK